MTADFEASLVAQKQRACDANHLQFRLRFEGSQTSSDSRLTGDLEARVDLDRLALHGPLLQEV